MCAEVTNYAKLVDRGLRPKKIRPLDQFLDSGVDAGAKSDAFEKDARTSGGTVHNAHKDSIDS